jgi:hypothetical protein
MLIEEINQIRSILKPLRRYDKLISLYETQKTDGYAFELYFAYSMEKEGIKLQYEKRANTKQNMTVDFYCAHKGNQLWFELVSPDKNETIKNDIEQQHKNTKENGISYHDILIQSRAEDIHYDHAAQLIRLQEKILKKVEKFTHPTDNIFNIIMVDCSQYIGRFDDEDFRNLVYGYAKNHIWQEHINGQRMLGLLENSFNKRNSQELKNKMSAIICINQLTTNLFSNNNAYISCNPLLGSEYYHKAIAALKSINPLRTIIYIKPIQPNTIDLLDEGRT